MFQWCSHNGMAREQCTERNVHIISSYVYLSCRSPYMTVYGTERNGEKRNGLGTYSNILYWWMTVYGAERGIKRMIIYISA